MQTRTDKSSAPRRGKTAATASTTAALPAAPAVSIDPNRAPDAPVAPTETRGPLERREDGTEIDWARTETLRQGSAAWVAVWLLVPFCLCLIYGYLTR